MQKKNDRTLALARTTLKPLATAELNAARGGLHKPDDDPHRNSGEPPCP